MFLEEVPTDASPRLDAEKGANACLSEAVERCKNAGAGAALKGGFAAEINADRFA
jgi:hypothetical protein